MLSSSIKRSHQQSANRRHLSWRRRRVLPPVPLRHRSPSCPGLCRRRLAAARPGRARPAPDDSRRLAAGRSRSTAAESRTTTTTRHDVQGVRHHPRSLTKETAPRTSNRQRPSSVQWRRLRAPDWGGSRCSGVSSTQEVGAIFGPA